MKKIFLAVATAALLLLPLSAQASDKTGFYVAPKFVLSMQHTEANHKLDHPQESYSSIGFGDTTDTNAGFAIAVGYDFAHKFNVPLRAEVEYGIYGDATTNVLPILSPDLNFKTKVGIETVMLNLYWDIAEFYGFKPYVGTGLGVAIVDTELTYSYLGYGSTGSGRNKETVFAWQLGFGISYAFNDTFSANLGYRFLMAGDGKTNIDSSYKEASYTSVDSKGNYMHQVMLGLRMTF